MASWKRFISILCLSLFSIASFLHGQSEKIIIGITPAFDSSGEPFNKYLLPHLTLAIYKGLLENTALEPVLLAPGSLFDPTNDEITLLDYAKMQGLDLLLIVKSLPTTPFDSRHQALNIQSTLINVSTKQHAPTETNTQLHLLKSEVEGTSTTSQYEGLSAGLWDPSLKIQRNPIGKAALQLADAIASYTQKSRVALYPPHSGKATSSAKGNFCQASFRISYPTKNASSKSYNIIINGKEESASIHDGIVKFSAPSGPITLQIQTQDAPYKLPVQDFYLLSSFHDCESSRKNLIMEIGRDGEALLRWE